MHEVWKQLTPLPSPFFPLCSLPFSVFFSLLFYSLLSYFLFLLLFVQQSFSLAPSISFYFAIFSSFSAVYSFPFPHPLHYHLIIVFSFVFLYLYCALFIFFFIFFLFFIVPFPSFVLDHSSSFLFFSYLPSASTNCLVFPSAGDYMK